MNWKDKALIGFGFVVVVFFVFLVSLGKPKHTYKLPNGDTVRCEEMEETSSGNFHLTGCDGDVEYLVQGMLEIVK